MVVVVVQQLRCCFGLVVASKVWMKFVVDKLFELLDVRIKWIFNSSL